jgi:histone-lysine N-methyltransferase SUV39H
MLRIEGHLSQAEPGGQVDYITCNHWRNWQRAGGMHPAAASSSSNSASATPGQLEKVQYPPDARYLAPCDCSEAVCGGAAYREQLLQLRKHGMQVAAIIKQSQSGGLGLFALQEVKEGTAVVAYVGEVISSEKAKDRDEGEDGDEKEGMDRRVGYAEQGLYYLWDMKQKPGSMEGETKYVVDATRMGNASRFINHSCNPNCEAKDVCQGPDSNKSFMEVVFVALRDIRKGEEFTLDYCPENAGLSLQEGIVKCCCGTPQCR